MIDLVSSYVLEKMYSFIKLFKNATGTIVALQFHILVKSKLHVLSLLISLSFWCLLDGSHLALTYEYPRARVWIISLLFSFFCTGQIVYKHKKD